MYFSVADLVQTFLSIITIPIGGDCCCFGFFAGSSRAANANKHSFATIFAVQLNKSGGRICGVTNLALDALII